jgi:FkbM family methyltransferase
MFLKYYQKIDDAISYLLSSVSNEKKLIQNIFKKKNIIYVDIGTNEGNFLDFLSSFCNFKKIICFEPIKELTDKIDIKKYSNKILIYNMALSNKNSIKNFYQYDISSQSSLYQQNNLFKSLKKLKKKFKVKTIKFDDKFKNYKNIDFCKIDVQGEEWNVLQGMKKSLINKKIKLIKIEISFIERYRGSKSNFLSIINYLSKFGYYLISISKIKYLKNEILLMDAYFQIK